MPAIDLTARNVQDEVKKAGLPWSAAKGTSPLSDLTIGYNTFLPISGFIPKEKIPDPHDVRLELKVNGVTKQNDKTDLMIFKIPELMEAVTDVMPLLKGDMLLSMNSLFMVADG
jgi:acylpyruvate hydrolase